MNERIKELINQAGTDCSGKWMGTNHAEKFAELIVQECVVIVADAVDRREPASTYVGKIKEYFGVEE